MRKYSFIFVIALSILSHSCDTPGAADLSKDEKALIAGSDSLMRVLTVYDKEDSLLLRNVSIDFTDRDLLSKDFEALAAKMLHTVQDPSQDGVGIAAPQVGLNRRVICIPGWAGSVPRYQNIIVSYTDPETLQTVKERVEGYTAVIFQHEIDHLDGILYTDRADSLWVDER